jgi:hypothetical protein
MEFTGSGEEKSRTTHLLFWRTHKGHLDFKEARRYGWPNRMS